MRALRVVAIAAAVAALCLALFPAFLAIRSMGSKVFEPEVVDYALLGASTFAMALGLQVVPWRAMRYIAALAIFASGFLLFGFLAVFSIGLAFLPAGLVLLLLLYNALRRAPRGAVPTRAALGGAAFGFALPLLYIALSVPATVECRPNGAGGTSSRRWRAPSTHLTTGSTSADGRVVSGWMDDGDSYVTFRCEDGRVVSFQRMAR